MPNDLVITRPGPRSSTASRRWRTPSTPTSWAADRCAPPPCHVHRRVEILVAGPSLARAGLVLGGGLLLAAGARRAPWGSGRAASPARSTRPRSSRIAAGLPIPVTWSPGAEQIVWELRLPRALTAHARRRRAGDGRHRLPGAAAQPARRSVRHRHGGRRAASAPSPGSCCRRSCRRWRSARGRRWLGVGLAQVLAFVGGLGTVLLVYAVARTAGRVPVVTLLLSATRSRSCWRPPSRC